MVFVQNDENKFLLMYSELIERQPSPFAFVQDCGKALWTINDDRHAFSALLDGKPLFNFIRNHNTDSCECHSSLQGQKSRLWADPNIPF